MQTAVKLTERETKLLAELRASAEGIPGAEMSVYLPNCPSSRERGFNGVLSSLKKKGLYLPEPGSDGCFGVVVMEPVPSA